MGRRWSQNSILNPSATHLEADGCRCLAKTISRHRRNKNVTKLIRPSVIEIRNQKLQREPFHLDFHIESFAKRTMYAWMYDDIYVYCTPSKRNWKFLLLEWSFPFNITIMLDSNFTSFIFLILLLVFKQSTISMRIHICKCFLFVFIIPRTLSVPRHQHFNTAWYYICAV
jgi:hypothetical protein